MFENLNDIPLFLSPRSLIKSAGRYKKLSDSVSSWGPEILDALYTDCPELNDRQLDIQWESKDDKTGNAVGRVTVDEKIAIPVFVQDRKLAPLDTFVYKGRPRRMSPERLKEALFRPDLFEGVITPSEERGLMSDMPLHQAIGLNPWAEGRTSYASILEDILPTVTQEDLSKFADTINQDPQIGVNFMAGGPEVEAVLSRVLSHQPKSLDKHAQDLTDQLPVSVAQFRVQADGLPSMTLVSDAAYSPVSVTLTRSKFASVLKSLGITDSARALRKAGSAEGLTVTLRDKDQEPVLVSDLASAEAIDKFGYYLVKDQTGNEHEGWVFPEVYTITKEATGKMLFVGENLRVLQDRIAGVPVEKRAELTMDLPKVGDFGSFVFEGHGNAIAMEPVRVRSIEKNGSELMIQAMDALGHPYSFRMSDKAHDLVPLAGQPDAYLLPATAKYASFKDGMARAELVSDPKVLVKMAAADLAGDNKCRIDSYAKGRAFFMTGGPADSMGVAGEEQDKAAAILSLASMGISAEKAESLIEKAAASGSITIGNLRAVVSGEAAFGQEKQAQILQTLASLPDLKQDTIKLAADIKDPECLDRILSLGFLNPSNIGILIDHMDDLEATGSRLSEMLIACRMGANKDINEDAVIQARQAIDETLTGLANLRSRLGPQTAMAAGDSGS